MTLQFSANLSMLWPDRPPIDRFRAASVAGFSHVEMLFPQTIPRSDLTSVLDETGLAMALFDLNAGDWEAGERGIAALPDRVEDARVKWDGDLELAETLGTKTITVLAGIRDHDVHPSVFDEVLVENLTYLAEHPASQNITFCVEAINNHDVPGFHIRTVDHAAAIVDRVGSDRVRIQLDQYHVSMEEQDPRGLAGRYLSKIGHVQIADAPGRHEPGSGQAGVIEFLAELETLGYDGRIGLEYSPSGPTEETLDWLPIEMRR